MPRFFRLVLLLIFISAATLLAARSLGGMRPPSPLISVMSGPDGIACDHPCLFGVRPGVTNITEAVLMLQSHPLTHGAKWLDDHTLRLIGPEAYVAFSHTPDELVDSITFTDNLDDRGVSIPGSLVDSMTLGELMLSFGDPDVQLPGSDYFVVIFPSVGITAASVRPFDFRVHVRAEMPLNSLMISVFRPCPEGGSIFEVNQWMGFTTIYRYTTHRKQFKVLDRSSGVPIPPMARCKE